MSIQQRLQSLGITLPPLATPAAAYVPFVRTGDLVFVSGHIARKDGKPWVGQLGGSIGTEEGKLAARAIAIDLLGTLQAAVGGDLERVKRIVKVMSLVNSTPGFTEQHLVTNGCSELLVQVFGPEIGSHARSAFGVAQIPLGACGARRPPPGCRRLRLPPRRAGLRRWPCCAPCRWRSRSPRSMGSTCSRVRGASCSG